MKKWIVAAALALPIGAFAQDSCKDILADGFFNEPGRLG